MYVYSSIYFNFLTLLIVLLVTQLRNVYQFMEYDDSIYNN